MAAKPKEIVELERYYGFEIENERYHDSSKGLILLDLTGKNIKDIIQLSSLSRLQQLFLQGNQISDISSLAHLINLTRLNLSGNQIIDVSPLSHLIDLAQLDLSGNQIIDVSPLAHLSNLAQLDLSANPISDISPLTYLINLIRLDLVQNKISDISPLANLINLTGLYLSENQICDIDSLAQLTNLIGLYLSKNQISDISSLAHLMNLTMLDLSENEINDISPLTNLINLSALYLWENKISDISPLGNLISLTGLNLRENRINDISILTSLINLTGLDLLGNQISDISPLRDMTQLTYLNIAGNPVTNEIPDDIYQAGAGAIIDWLKSEDGAKIKLNEVKVLLLGNTNVGKSTLLYYLQHSKVEGTAGKSTDGIDYQVLDDLMDNVHLHVWDFGGQEYFHATHKLFFSPGAIHVLLWSLTDIPREAAEPEATFELAYWLRCIEQLCHDKKQGTRVDAIVAENKVDLQGGIPTAVNQLALKNSFSNIDFQHTAINLIPDLRLEGFKELLRERIGLSPMLNTDWPAFYKPYLGKIKANEKPWMRIREIAKNKSAEEQARVQNTMEVFHNMGFLLYFREIVPDMVFTDPKKLLDFLYKTILNDQAKKDGGRIRIEDLKKAVSGEENVFGLSYEQVERLLFDFDLLFRTEDREAYYAPQYLPKEQEGWIDLFSRYHFSKRSVRIESDSYLMNLALLKLFTRYGRDVKRGATAGEHLFWRDGLVIEKNGQVLLVKYARNEQRFELYNDQAGQNLALQKEVVDFIIGLYEEKVKEIPARHGPRIRLKVPEQDWAGKAFTISITVDGEHHALWRDIIKTEYAQFKSNGHSFNLRDFKQYLPKNNPKMKKLFISYSKKDLEQVHKLIDHLSALHINGLVDTWYCTKLEVGQKWDSEIRREFDEADIVCFLVSPNFMQTKYILDVEVTEAFKRLAKDPKFKIVPIYLNYCNWKTKENDLQQFSALPYTLRPIADFKNPDMAWYIVEESLRTIIEKDLTLKSNPTEAEPDGIPTDIRQIYERIVNGEV